MMKHSRRGFTLVEIMLVLAISAVIMAIGVALFSNRQAINRLHQQAKRFEDDIVTTLRASLDLACPMRMIPCTNAACLPTPGPIIGWAVQVRCNGTSPCDQNCDGTDGYTLWDFSKKPELFDQNTEAALAFPFSDGISYSPSDTADTGLIFQNNPDEPIVFRQSGTLTPAYQAKASDLDNNFGIILALGLKGASPIGTTGKAGFSVLLSASGESRVIRCENGAC